MQDFLKRAGRTFFNFSLPAVITALAIATGAYLWIRTDSKVISSPPTLSPFTIAVLPDTQVYAQLYPERFYAQTAWIAAHKQEKNIAFVTHLGDIVQHNTDEEWRVADKAMRTIDGIVPYGIAPGNHDLLADGTAPLYAKYFPMSRLKQAGAWGGSFLEETKLRAPSKPQMDTSSYQLFSAGGTDFIVFNLEFCPSSAALDWTGRVLRRYSDRTAIIATHSFLNANGYRQDARECNANFKRGGSSGVDIWDKLINQQRHDNILFFLSGHDIWTETGGARRTDIVRGKPVHQLLSNYQHLPNGGDGYLRLMTFNPRARTVHITTYSPYLDKFRTDPANDFELRW